MKEETEDWLEKAESDFDDASFSVEHGRNTPGAFFLHQAAEKALKAIQVEEEGEYSYSHDLLELAPEEARDEFLEVLRDLNPVYTGVRYPNIDMDKVENLEELKQDVEELIEWTRRRLEE